MVPSASVSRTTYRHSWLFIRIRASHLSILCVLYEFNTVHLTTLSSAFAPALPPGASQAWCSAVSALLWQWAVFSGIWLLIVRVKRILLRHWGLAVILLRQWNTTFSSLWNFWGWGVETLDWLPNHRWQLLTSSFMPWIWGGNCNSAFFCKNASCVADLDQQPQVFTPLCSPCVY